MIHTKYFVLILIQQKMYYIKTIISNFILKGQRTWSDLFTLDSSNDKDIHTGIHSTASRLVVLSLRQFCPLGEHWIMSGYTFSVVTDEGGCSWPLLGDGRHSPVPKTPPCQRRIQAKIPIVLRQRTLAQVTCFAVK